MALEVEKIISQDITDLRSFRVEIPKGDPEEVLEFYKKNPGKEGPGKMRPLGVPTKPGRVVLHMWNNFLVMFVEEEIKKFNHAYMPGKGTITALSQLVTDVTEYRFIYEFDIKGFFNNVRISEVKRHLYFRGMPGDLVTQLQKILGSIPENLKKLNKFLDTSKYDDYLNVRQIFDPYRKMDNIERMNRARMGDTQSGLRGDKNRSATDLGLPQGAAPSTILSLLTLTDGYKGLEKEGVKLLMYADDGILYSNKDFREKIKPPRGYEFAEEKSRWLKQIDGDVERFRFLGVDYIPSKGLFEGHTRKGSKLKFRPSEDNMIEFLRKVNSYGFSGDKMGMLAKSTIFGQALSRLYEGSGDKVDHVGKVVHNKKSYGGKYHSLDALENSKYLTRVASSISCLGLEKLVAFSMGKIEKKEFKKEQLKHPREAAARIKLAASAERENLRRIALNKAANRIDEADVNESVKGQNTWDSRAPGERG